MVSNEQRRLVWQGLLRSDYQARYYGRLASKLERREKLIALSSAILSSGAIFALVKDVRVELLPESLSFIVVNLSLYIAFARVGRTAMLASWQYAKWSRMETRFERLWKRLATLDEQTAELEWWKLVEQGTQGSDTMPIEFPENKRLARRCQREAIRARTGKGTTAAATKTRSGHAM